MSLPPGCPEATFPAPRALRSLGLLAPLFCAALLAGVAAAADFEEGEAAYQGGDYESALSIFSELAERGELRALRRLVTMYERGLGVSRNEQQVLRYLTRGAGLGASDLQQQLGLRYYYGRSVGQDPATAAEWFTKAAAQGLDEAQYSLAVLYAFGKGVDQDYQEALRWFRDAATQGNAAAQYNLGVFHERAYGVPRDLEEARSWYRRAAEQGLQQARERLLEWDGEAPPGPPAAPELTTTPEPAAPAAPAAPPEAVPAPESRTAAAPTRHPDSIIRRADWVRERPPAHYTLQFISALNENEVLRMITGHTWEREVGYVRLLVQGRIRYNGVYGSFIDQQAARAAISELPPEAAEKKPWPRRFEELQQLLQESTP